MQRAAVIDMGSNSFRLVVFGYQPGRYRRHVDEIREAVRVGEGMSEDETITGYDRRRLRLTPGMTGHWQIMGSARVPMHEMVKIDSFTGVRAKEIN